MRPILNLLSFAGAATLGEIAALTVSGASAFAQATAAAAGVGEPGLVGALANLGGLGMLAGVLFYLHLMTLKNAREDMIRLMDQARQERHDAMARQDAMLKAIDQNTAITSAIADRLKVPDAARQQ